ncbi:NAD-dependent epimerase/dehydratase family protein [Agromyces albus]|uniref:NAD-dependent epimerase/dehydratase family protein n=1 Tax=Agromyces albus TaxID=205332 RepID=A0A4Q2KPS9_9MICO|nr:NAD-dependent epimerase/dehydratase family protein [Agromyces albus]RXZ67388.1 NAD-dependent epimerase/dehydratase family protein [Agromyces albus]
MALRVLFIGGNGIISSASSALAVERGHELTLLNRGTSTLRPRIDGVRHLVGDAGDAASVAAAIGDETFDVVANFRSFSPAQVARDIELFEGRCRQYVYISSASAYQKPVARLPITESTPLRNPYWQYSRDKIASEDLLVTAYRERGFPTTIIRPSHTYDGTSVPLLGGWTAIERMRRGAPVVVQGDGTSLWTMTHTRDFAVAFVGLLGNDRAIGEAFHITSDEVLTWNQITQLLARAAGTSARIVHIASESIARELPEHGPGLLGDKAHSVIFDNSKVKSLVPEYRAITPFWQGAREIAEWHDADPSRRIADPQLDAAFDRLVARFGG